MHIIVKIMILMYGWLAFMAFQAVRILPKFGRKKAGIAGWGEIWGKPSGYLQTDLYRNKPRPTQQLPPMTKAEKDHIDYVLILQQKGKGMKP